MTFPWTHSRQGRSAGATADALRRRTVEVALYVVLAVVAVVAVLVVALMRVLPC